jgi:mono/diheme cytochrome c family protein
MALVLTSPREARADGPWRWKHRHLADLWSCTGEDGTETGALGGTWYWLHSPEEEKRIVAALYNRYCIRCHGVDGRGVWDIPGIPNFTDVRWQGSRSDAQIARIILEGRGAVMPPFRGALSLEEAWAMGRYLRSFVPGTETPRPDMSGPVKPMLPADVPNGKKPTDLPK